MNIAFRLDSSFTIGSGHVMRCLVLADELAAKGAKVIFICKDLPGNVAALLTNKGYPVLILPPTSPEDADAEQTVRLLTELDFTPDWLVVDHYGLGLAWEKRLLHHTAKLMVIDDYVGRPHYCHLLLNQNLLTDKNSYAGIVPRFCRVLTGPAYALLRPEFRANRQEVIERADGLKRLLIFFGGTDPTNETEKALNALQRLKAPIATDVVVGMANPNKEKIRELCHAIPNVAYHCQIDNMAQLMQAADLSLGAGGITTWERCFSGLPSITVAVAENQILILENAAEAGVTCYLGRHDAVTAEMLAQALAYFLNNADQLRLMSRKAHLATFRPDDSTESPVVTEMVRCLNIEQH